MSGLLLRFIYAILLPVCGLVMLKWQGLEIGMGRAFAIACGIFVYHYLQWALFETDRTSRNRRDRSWIFWLLSIGLVAVLTRGRWQDWPIEQLLLEVVAFSAGIAILGIYKAAGEGKNAPWFLVILVFVAPPVAMIWTLCPFWLSRHLDDSPWTWCGFVIAFVFAVQGFFLRMKPFAMGSDQLSEPLKSGGRVVVAVLWLIILLAGAVALFTIKQGSVDDVTLFDRGMQYFPQSCIDSVRRSSCFQAECV